MADGGLPELLRGTGRRTVGADEIVDLLLLCGWATDLADGVEDARQALTALVAAGLPHEDGRFDPAETINFIKLRRVALAPFWRDRYVATGRALVAGTAGLTGGDDPPDLGRLPPRRFSLTIRRRFSLHGVAAGAPLRLRLPLPIADARLYALTVVPIVPAEAAWRIGPARLEARLPRAAGDFAEIGAKLSFVADPAAPDHSPALPAWSDASAVPPAVSEQAKRVAGALRDPDAIARALYDHLLDAFAYGVMPYDRLGSGAAEARLLEAGWYDCRIGAGLLVAMARTLGLPARLAGGTLLWRAPTEHHWAEVLIPERGWLPFDLGGWDLSDAGADPRWRHLLAGAADYRMTSQRLPTLFTGVPGVPFSPAWHRLMRLIPGGTETRFVSIPDGRLIMAEEVRIDPPPPSEDEGRPVRPLDAGTL